MKEATELVFIPMPIMGHIVSAVEMAKRVLSKQNGGGGEEEVNLIITVLILKQQSSLDAQTSNYIQSQTTTATDDDEYSGSQRLKFVTLTLPPQAAATAAKMYFDSFIPQVRDWVSGTRSSGDLRRLVFVVDLLCTGTVDVANEFGIPAYVFFSSGAAALGLIFFLQSIKDRNLNDPFLNIPTYAYPFPARCLPPPVLDKNSLETFLGISERVRGTKGVLVNTFLELEPQAVKTLSDEPGWPPIYPIGPLLNLQPPEGPEAGEEEESRRQIMKWLDRQEDGSVVFLCFGSQARFTADHEEQVKEIAAGLERSGQRFLWAFRSAGDDDRRGTLLLPGGFLERTGAAGVGMVVNGWAPQTAILAHRAVGGFVSHCGWNSTLESLWFGKPVATWPMQAAEQEANAFQLVKEIGVGVEIKLSTDVTGAEEIGRGIKQLMDPLNPVRFKAKELGEKSRLALAEGGSSSTSLARFVEDAINTN
ncbi:unnamed protein product [Cuscuta epithymum]|uniref:Glycosyltransferase n=1 Tax=Cuscuta epithymum TaxID=186058 RepID=A0AAV0C2A6_9ASTE|nr:unnamed protein product [Cuscuta epithymum]